MYYKIPEFRVHWKLFKLSEVGAKQHLRQSFGAMIFWKNSIEPYLRYMDKN